MKCPSCTTDLVIAERQGVEIDHCPRCRGVWLDRGELDKIIDRTGPNAFSAPASHPRRDDDDDDHDHDDEWLRQHPRRGGDAGHPTRRKSFLSDLFDFG